MTLNFGEQEYFEQIFQNNKKINLFILFPQIKDSNFARLTLDRIT